jgi:hypothetical protein
MNNIPYDQTNSSNPYLINTNGDSHILDSNGQALSAEYIWSKNGVEREKLVSYVFDYYRTRGFPYPKYSDDRLRKSFEKIKNIDTNGLLVNDELKNSNSTGTDIVKHFCGIPFYNSKVEKGLSPMDVFNNDTMFIKVLKNRMGWCSSSEDGTSRPYIFGINDGMIIQGIRSSGLGSSISQFKPAIAKYIYSKYVPKDGVVLDYSSGWGARALAAMSLNLTYYGIDPLTSKENNNILNFFNGKGKVINGVGEDIGSYIDFEKVDLVLSSPPYFNLEIYSNDKTQSYNKYENYGDWLTKYWDITVKNCMSVMKASGYFCLVISEISGKYDIAKDMIGICNDNGLNIIKTYPLKTSRSHLSGKKKSKNVVKNTEAIYVMKIV